MMLEKRQSQQSKSSSAEVEQLQAKLAKMQTALDESYDIIDEMDFELESVIKSSWEIVASFRSNKSLCTKVDLLEMQNKSLREELAALRTQLDEGAAQVPSAVPADDDDPPPKYEPTDQARRSYRQHVASSTCDCCLKNDDADAESLERAAMTHSVSHNK